MIHEFQKRYIFDQTIFTPFLENSRNNPWGVQTKPQEKFIQLSTSPGTQAPERCPWWSVPHQVYYLYAYISDDNYTCETDAKWADILTAYEYNQISDGQFLVLGYMVIDVPKDKNSGSKIHFTRSFVKNKGILRLMLEKANKSFPFLYPYDIKEAPLELKTMWFRNWVLTIVDSWYLYENLPNDLCCITSLEHILSDLDDAGYLDNLTKNSSHGKQRFYNILNIMKQQVNMIRNIN